MNIRFRSSAAATALLSLCFGCAGGVDGEGEANAEEAALEGIAESEQPLYSESSRVMWPSSVIPVCWHTTTWNDPSMAAFRQTARDAVENSYGRVTNLRFTGWDLCPSNPVNRIRMLLGAGFGQTNPGYFAGQVTELTASPTLHVFMHEFAHALGFDHEFDQATATNPCQAGAMIPAQNARPYTPYDNASITTSTYCHANATLSPWDVVGLQRVYGRKPIGSLVGANNKCAGIDNPGGAQPTGATRLEARDCVGSNNQFWRYDDLHRFQANSFTYGFMDVQWAASANGTPIWNWVSNPGPAQTWEMTGVQIVGTGDLCLEVPSNSWFSGQTLRLAVCDASSTAQKWTIKSSGVANQPFRIAGTGGNSNLCVALNGQGPGATLSACTNSKTAILLWQRHIVGGGQNGCLDVQLGNAMANTPVIGWTCNWAAGIESQYWKVRGPIHGLANKCLDLGIGNGAVNGAPLQLWDCNGWANQSWEYHF